MEAATQILGIMKSDPHEKDIESIQFALTTMLRDIKAGIQTQTPTTELVTAQLTEAMMKNIVKGSGEQSLVPQITFEQLAGVYSALPGSSPELGKQFSGLIENFIRDYMDIAQKQGLTNERPDE